MTKATHNGTCQACGRKQAYRGTIAKHGYTVDYGYFSGTCGGSDRQPLELETSYNVETVAAIRDWADQQDAKADSNITKVPVEVADKSQPGFYNYKTVMMDRAEFVAQPYQCDRDFDEDVSSLKFNLRRAATSARKDADLLDALREKTFGNELEARDSADAPQPKRESFSREGRDGALHQAYDRQRELKEEGIKSRVTGSQSYATITYRK